MDQLYSIFSAWILADYSLEVIDHRYVRLLILDLNISCIISTLTVMNKSIEPRPVCNCVATRVFAAEFR